MVAVSVLDEARWTRLRDAIWELTGLIRVYLRTAVRSTEPLRSSRGRPSPTSPTGVHHELGASFTGARVWGPSARFDGQRVGRDHDRLDDGDTVRDPAVTGATEEEAWSSRGATVRERRRGPRAAARSLRVVELAGSTIGRATYQPGWKWSEHVGAALGRRSLPRRARWAGPLWRHNRITMDDGRIVEVGPGDLFHGPARPRQ